MSDMQIEKRDKEQILLATSSNPLDSYYLDYCDTDDRKRHFEEIREYYQVLHSYLASFFTGEENHVEIDLTQGNRKHFKAARDEILALYTLVLDAWPFVSLALEKMRITEIRSPGELMRRLIDIEADGRFFVCCPLVDGGNDYVEFSPRKNAKAITESKRRYQEYRVEFFDFHSGRQTSTEHMRTLPLEIFEKLDRYEKFKSWIVLMCIDAANQDESLLPQIWSYIRAHRNLCLNAPILVSVGARWT